jgi:lipid A 3-O-deacylase
MSGKLYGFIIGLMLVCNGLFAQSYRNEIGIQSDNDSYLAQGSDRYYTNGIFVYYRHALKNTSKPNIAGKILGFEAGQKLFNPQSGNIPSPNYIDRPFAGYLYVGSNLNILYKNESNLKLGIQAGIIGPSAHGEEVQKLIHRTFGFYPPNGWQYQVKNSAQLNLSAAYGKLLGRASWIDASIATYANLGTGFNGLGAGTLIRLGDFNQLFNSYSTQSNTLVSNASAAPLHQHEFFAFYKPMLSFVAYDATIQGNIFDKDDTDGEITKDIEPFVFSQQIGGAYSSNRWTFSLAGIFNTKDVKNVKRKHQWASAMLLYRFN